MGNKSVTSVTKKPTEGIMAKTVTKLDNCTPSVTSVTKRNKRNKLKLDSSVTTVTRDPLGSCDCYACPGSVQKAINNLVALKTEVLLYLNAYTSRGYHAEGIALVRLRKAVTGNFPAPSPGSPGSPERAAEQRIRNERATRMADALARKKVAER